MHRALNLEHKRPTGEPFSLSEEKFANGDPGGWEPTEFLGVPNQTFPRCRLLKGACCYLYNSAVCDAEYESLV